MPIKPLRQMNLYMPLKQKASMQVAAAQAGMSVSAFGRSIVYAALGKVDEGGCKNSKNRQSIAKNNP